MRDELLKQAKRVVIKIGSSLIASRETGLRAERRHRESERQPTFWYSRTATAGRVETCGRSSSVAPTYERKDAKC